MIKLSQQEIFDILPQKKPFVFVDNIEIDGESATAKYLSTPNQGIRASNHSFLKQNLMIEALAQFSLVFLLKTQQCADNQKVFITKIDSSLLKSLKQFKDFLFSITNFRHFSDKGFVEAESSSNNQSIIKAKIYYQYGT